MQFPGSTIELNNSNLNVGPNTIEAYAKNSTGTTKQAVNVELTEKLDNPATGYTLSFSPAHICQYRFS